jgi:uncharacterized protein YggT (Ycf19 family)
METTGATGTPPAHASGWLTVGKVAKVLLWLVYAWVLVNLVLLVLAFVLLLFGASPDASFVEWVYRSVQRSMAPFRGMFQPIPLNGESVLDTSLLFAAIVYSLVALGLRAAIDWLTEKLTPPRPVRQHRAPGPPGAGPWPTDPSYPAAPAPAPRAPGMPPQ